VDKPIQTVKKQVIRDPRHQPFLLMSLCQAELGNPQNVATMISSMP
jgi:hypothetical protein